MTTIKPLKEIKGDPFQRTNEQPTVKDYLNYCSERGLEPKYAENLFQFAEWVKQNE